MKRSDTYRKQSRTFGPWLAARIKQAGLTQGEFAARVGASKSSVSRWINGRVPEASFLDAIADVLVLEYDTVATQAGYRPDLPMDQLEKWQSRLRPYLRRLDPDDPEVWLAVESALQQQLRVKEIREGTRTVERFWDPIELEDKEE